MVQFFPHFVKQDYFTHKKQQVIDVALGGTNGYYLTKDRETD
jgi:hypothetical protein